MKIAKRTWWLMIIVLLAACKNECEVVTTNRHPLLADLSEFVPYESGQTVRFRRSGGKIITYPIKREKKDIIEDDCHAEQLCCHWEYVETDITSLTHSETEIDAPFLFVHLSYIDSVSTLLVQVDKFHFYINQPDIAPPAEFDSVRIGDHWYHDVWKVSESFLGYYADPVTAEYLYYNREYGILKVTRTDGVNFELAR